MQSNGSGIDAVNCVELVINRDVTAGGTDSDMPRHRCTVCGNTKNTDPSVSLHRIPTDLISEESYTWMEATQLQTEAFGLRT